MEIKLLGPLEAHQGGRSIAPSASKPRQILALLALQPGRVVTVPAIVEELWGTTPPRSALTTLQTYVMQLRRRIAAALPAGAGEAKDVLATRYGGYVLEISPENVDHRKYERLATAGSRALEMGDCESASRLLRSALSLWRGEALVDVQKGFQLAVEVARLDETRLAAVESRIEADLRLGRHFGLLSELAVLTARHPMHENLYAQYMIALCRAGRQWQALELFRSFRESLVRELGVEPSARLHRLQRAILNADPILDDDVAPQPLYQRLA